MKLRIKYSFINDDFVFDDEEVFKAEKLKKLKHKKHINICLKRYLHKKLLHISKILKVSGWNVTCEIEKSWTTKKHELKLRLESFDKKICGVLYPNKTDVSKIAMESQDSYNPIFYWSWLRKSLENQIIIDDIKDKNKNLDFYMKLKKDDDIYNEEYFKELKEKYENIFEYLKIFNIYVLYYHSILIRGQNILWNTTYRKINPDVDKTKENIDFILYMTYVQSERNEKTYYSTKDVSNEVILKTLFEQNILDINTFDEDKKEVTKEDIKEYFELNNMCSY